MTGIDLHAFDREGRPLDFESWARLFADKEHQRVAEDQIGPYWVSTIWLGLDHGHGRTDEPIIFETMVFVPDDAEGLGPDVDGRRYATEAAAREGHAELVTLIRATTPTRRRYSTYRCAMSSNAWTSRDRDLSNNARWAITWVSCAVMLSLELAAATVPAPVGIRLALFALVFLVWWAFSVAVTGYRPATAEQAAALTSVPLWHVSHTRAWDPIPSPGDVFTMTPSRCRPWSRMHVQAFPPGLKKAVFATRVHPARMPRWGFPTFRRNLTLALELVDQTDPVGVYVRADGAVGFTTPIRVTVTSVTHGPVRSIAQEASTP